MNNKQIYKSVSKYKNMDISNFIEEYLGIKLSLYQKFLLKINGIKGKIYYNLFSPIRPFNISNIIVIMNKERKNNDNRTV